jgi:hypothetical protein
MLSKMGYRELNFMVLMPSARRERWKAVTPSLGFSGSGFFGHSAGEMKSMLSDAGISVPSLHTDLDTLQNAMGGLSEAAKTLGATYVILPAIPDDKRKTLDDYRKMADTFNRIGEAAQKSVFHLDTQSWYGLKEMDGKIPLELLLDNTDRSSFTWRWIFFVQQPEARILLLSLKNIRTDINLCM